jgi:hypothetical protein
MAGFKSLLLRVEVRPAGRRCQCSHNKKHIILKGESRIVVKAPGVATPEKGYCTECGREMISRSQKALRNLEQELGA